MPVHRRRAPVLLLALALALVAPAHAEEPDSSEADVAALHARFAEMASPLSAKRERTATLVRRHADVARRWARSVLADPVDAATRAAALSVLGLVGNDVDLQPVYEQLCALATPAPPQSSRASAGRDTEIAPWVDACLQMVERLEPKYGPWLPANSLPPAVTPHMAAAICSRLDKGAMPACVRHGGEGLRPALTHVVGNPRLRPERRLRAAAILARMGGDDARRALGALSPDDFERGRNSLWYSLREVGGGDAMKPIHTWIRSLVHREVGNAQRNPPWSAWQRSERMAFLSFMRSVRSDMWRDSVISYLEDQIHRRGSGHVSYFESIARLYVALGNPSSYHLARIVDHAAGPAGPSPEPSHRPRGVSSNRGVLQGETSGPSCAEVVARSAPRHTGCRPRVGPLPCRRNRVRPSRGHGTASH